VLPFVRRSLGRKLLLATGVPTLLSAVFGVAWLERHTQGLGIGRLVLLGVLLLAAGTSAAHLLAFRLLVERPLQRLQAGMRRAQGGDFLHRVPVESTDELGELAEGFNTTLAAVTDLHARQLEDAQSLEAMRRELALKAQVEAQHKELTILFDLARTLNSTLELDELLELIASLLGRSLGQQSFVLLLADEEDGDLVAKSTYGMGDGLKGARVALSEGTAGWAARERQVLLVRDTRGDPRRAQDRWLSGREGSLLAVPMVYKGECVGVFDLFRPSPDAFDGEEVRLLQSVATQAAMAIANARLHQRMVKLSLTDPLTGAHNRRSLFARLEMELAGAARFGHPLSLAMIDLDRFKDFNDAHGHVAGDAALRRIAQLVLASVRKVDTLARYGGEEFALVLPRAGRADALAVAEKLRQLVAAGVDGEGRPSSGLTISAGVASCPEDAPDLESLIGCADLALYAAKRSGRNAVRAYEPGMRACPGRARDLPAAAPSGPA
jgi:diguanylate cyclase (GGDEF)-like protein